MLLCGVSSVLDVGSGNGQLVRELLSTGVDAKGVDISTVAVAYANSLTPGRFSTAPASALPFETSSSYTIVASMLCEYLSAEDLPKALAEFYRVSQRFLILQIQTKRMDENSPAQIEQERAWWEAECLKAGFRKHPLYYEVNKYEALHKEGPTIIIPLEKIPVEALESYPLTSLADERNLHMDMTREVGERSDAHIIRYEWAAQYLRRGDAVLDAACGLGYGSYVIRQRGQAASVVGIDGSPYAIDYATKNFAQLDPGLTFHEGYLPECLSQYPDGSFDAILSFETLEHVEDPEGLLREFKRLLSPGGRVIVSVPNDWTDDSGKDPNPYHLHVYSFEKLKQQVSKEFLVEAIYQQIASGCKLREIDNRWHRQPRTLRPVSLETESYPNSEWCLMVGLKDPVGATQAYRETFYRYSDGPKHLLQFARDYRNPWLVRTLVEFPTRATNSSVLGDIAARVLADSSNNGLPDEAAALCVRGYQLLQDSRASALSVQKLIERMRPHIELTCATGHAQRWKISLEYLAGQLFLKIGDQLSALRMLEGVAQASVENFSPSLGTKVINAAYESGLLHYAANRIEESRKYWQLAVDRSFELLKSPQGEFIGDPENPLIFPTVGGVEFLDCTVKALRALRQIAPSERWVRDRLYGEARQNWKWMIDERAEALKAVEELVQHKDAIIRDTEARVRNKDSIIQDTEALLQKKDLIIREAEALIDHKDVRIRDTEALVDRKDDLIRDTESRLDETRRVLNDVYAQLHDLTNRYNTLENMLSAGTPTSRAKRWFKRAFRQQ
jgi:SAM-dependent methyltransferase